MATLNGSRNSVIIYVYHYACPYCASKLIKVKSDEVKCGHDKGFFEGDKKCREENYECKEIMRCSKCEEDFKPSKEFLKKQKRKIKDG